VSIPLPMNIAKALPSIRQALLRPRNLIIIDAGESPPRALRAHFRAWLNGGVRILPLDREWLDDVDCLVGSDARLAILLPFGHQLARPIADLIDQLDARCYELFGIDPASGEIMPLVGAFPQYIDDWYAYAARTAIELTGTQTLRIPRALLPIELHVSSRSADAFSAQFAINGSGEDFSPGPPVWYRLDPGFEGILTVDRDPGFAGDTWRLEVGDASSGPAKTLTQTVPVSDTETGPLDFLAVLLDRTCPDNANWINAYNLVNGRISGDEDPWRNHQLNSERYNLDIRNGLADGLRMAFEAGLIGRLQTWWFKDTPGDEMANYVTSVPLNQSAVDQARPARSAVECGELFALAGYSPGLDLWDPLDEAFEQATTFLEARGKGGHRAILIVGNSPPTHPTQADSPLAALLTPPGARISCTPRRQSSSWHRNLAICTERAIPVIDVFLRHTNFGDVSPGIAEMYERSQNRVEKALGKTVELMTAVAERDAVRDAVLHAVHTLRERAGLASRVVLELPVSAAP
jgi:hypothetical protein